MKATYWESLLQAEVKMVQGRYRTRIIEAGDGDPLLLLHGTGGHAENYVRNLMPFSSAYRAIAMDFLWHGRSDTGGFDPEIIPPLVDQVRDVMDTLGIERAHLAGQSLGGWVAMRFALAHPLRVNKLVLTTAMGYEPPPGAVPGYVEPDRTRTLASSLEVLRDPSFENVRSRITRIVAHPEIVPDEAVAVRRAFYRDPAVNAVQRRFVSHYLGGPEPRRHLMTDALASEIRAPTLVYWGDRNTVPPSVGAYLASVIPEATFFSAPDTGHWAQFENHDIHNQQVMTFLNGHSRL